MFILICHQCVSNGIHIIFRVNRVGPGHLWDSRDHDDCKYVLVPLILTTNA